MYKKNLKKKVYIKETENELSYKKTGTSCKYNVKKLLSIVILYLVVFYLDSVVKHFLKIFLFLNFCTKNVHIFLVSKIS